MDRHIRRNRAAFVQYLGHGTARYPQLVGKLALRDSQLRQYHFTQQCAGVSGHAFFILQSIHQWQFPKSRMCAAPFSNSKMIRQLAAIFTLHRLRLSPFKPGEAPGCAAASRPALNSLLLDIAVCLAIKGEAAFFPIRRGVLLIDCQATHQ